MQPILLFSGILFSSFASGSEYSITFSDTSGQRPPRLVISHSLTSWVTGYSGPELESRIRYWNGPSVLAGFRYAFYQPFGQRPREFSLQHYYPDLNRGYIGYAGIGLLPGRNGTDRLRFFAEYAHLERNNRARICTSWEQPVPHNQYCICREVQDIEVPNSQTRLSLGFELAFSVIQRKRVGLEFGLRFQGYLIRSDRNVEIFSPQCNRSSGSNVRLENFHNYSETGLLVDGMPLYSSTDLTQWSSGLWPSLNLRLYYVVQQ
jgi:hypothetical protein